LITQPAQFSVNVPVADPGEIVSATINWKGRALSGGGDNTIVINGTEYTGDVSSTFQTGPRRCFFYKMDGMALVHPGLNNFTVRGFDPGAADIADGIGLLVVYQDPTSDLSQVRLLETDEFFYGGTVGYENGQVHNITFNPSSDPRNGHVHIFDVLREYASEEQYN
jgi:hypothetical protein